MKFITKINKKQTYLLTENSIIKNKTINRKKKYKTKHITNNKDAHLMKIMNPQQLLKAAPTVIFNLMFDHKLAIPG